MAFIGQSYRDGKDNLFPEYTGLHDQVSDVVARATFSPAPWLDLTYRTRLDAKTLATHMADTVCLGWRAEIPPQPGLSLYDLRPLHVVRHRAAANAGDRPGFFQPRNEMSVGASSNWGPYRFSAFARRDLTTNQMVAIGADAIYEDECFIVDLKFYRRYTSINNDNGSTALLILFTFKTIGQFGYRAL